MFDTRDMHSLHLRQQARDWHSEGVPFGKICERLGLPRGTVGKWVHGERSRRVAPQRSCFRCDPTATTPPNPANYTYLLGQYLGDGHIQRYPRAFLLTVACDERYPGIISEIDAAMRACGAKTTRHRQCKGCISVQSYSTHWPCLFPQAGPGRKHQRRIALEGWQQTIVDQHPGQFLRGLFHADGCRVINNVTIRGRRYAYPRYFLANESPDILALAGAALDRLGIEWRLNKRNSLSVAKRAAVARLDRHVGPKA